MLIECLMDAPYDYIYSDFVKSFENCNMIYKTKTTAKKYNADFSRNLKIITDKAAKDKENPKKSDWSKVDLVKSAEKFLTDYGMTAKEVKILKENLSGKVVRKINSKNVELPLGDKIYFLDTQYYKGKNKDKSKDEIQKSDAIILESKGKYAMIDTATEDQSSKIVKYLKELGIDELEFVVLTHAHMDHIGGYKSITENIKVKNVYLNKYTKKYKSANMVTMTKRMKNIVDISKKKNITIKYINETKNQTIELGNINMKLYNTNLKNVDDDNDNSIVALATIKGKKIYFAADIGGTLNESISKQIGNVDIYKVSHHGVAGNNKKEAIQILKPKYAIITSFKENRYATTINRLKESGTEDKNIYCTGNGMVILNIDNSGSIQFKQL